MSAPPSQPDHSGLQAVTSPPVPDHSGLQYVGSPETSDALRERQTEHSKARPFSYSSPEVVTSDEYEYLSMKQARGGNDGSHNDHSDVQPRDQRASYPPAYNDYASKELASVSRRDRSICGLRRRVFFWLLAVIVVIVILVAVVGGVVGSRSDGGSKQSPSASSGALPAFTSHSNAGVVVQSIDSSSGERYAYYQDTSGRIIESHSSAAKLDLQSGKVPARSIVATDAQSDTPLAVTSWVSDGSVYRQVFYLDANGLVMTTNTTSTTPWPQSYSILTNDSAAAESKALAVVADTSSTGLNGIRVYYGSAKGNYIQECGMDFNDSSSAAPVWYMWANFHDSDPSSGVAAVLSDSVNHLYLRNKTTNALDLWTWDYIAANDGLGTAWTSEAIGLSDMPAESDIAAARDGGGEDHIFFSSTNNELVRAIYASDGFSNYLSIAKLAPNSKISAFFNPLDPMETKLGVVVYYQNSTDPKVISYKDIDAAGNVLQRGFVV